MKIPIAICLNLIFITCYGQYPFEKFAQPNYEEHDDWKLYDWMDTKQTINHTLTIDDFFVNETLTIQLTSYSENIWDSSIRIFRGKTQIQNVFENMAFSQLNIGF